LVGKSIINGGDPSAINISEGSSSQYLKKPNLAFLILGEGIFQTS